MKTKHFLIGGLATLSLIMVSSCTDSNYDLEDVDTTARFKANDLIVPINLDVLTFDQVLDLDDDSEIVKDKDAEGKEIYAVKKEGNFHSDPIEVAKITATTDITPTTNTIPKVPSAPGATKAEFDLKNNVTPTAFKADASDIDKSIKSIDALGVTSTLTIPLEMTAMSYSDWNKVKITGLKIELPAGIICTPVSPSEADGAKFEKTSATHPDYSLLDLSAVELPATKSGSKGIITIKLDVTKYENVKRSNNTYSIDFDPTARTLAIADQVSIQEGIIVMAKGTSSFPSNITFKISPDMGDLVVETFTGKVQYDVENVNIEPIDLGNLPDFLRQDGTKMGIVNPQIYLAINNPVGDYATFESGFRMTPERDGIVGTPATLDAMIGGKWVENKDGVMTAKKSGTADQYFVLSPYPYKKTRDFAEFPNPSHESPYTGLRKVLDTPTKTPGVNGIPTKIYVETVSPQVPEQAVTDFKLGEKYGKVDAETSEVKYGVDGKYMFYAPLQLTNGTQICYVDTLDGWNDEDIDKLNITSLKLNMTVSTEVSFPIELTIIPTTFNSKPIPGVSANTVIIPADANGYDFEVVFKGEIAHLDGLLLKAKIMNSNEDTTLAPTMKIYMKDSKATLTGFYEKEL